jgi:hypothetical protein
MAAGQGFKTFVTGEVLTAGDVNGYLMQGINVFTNATARDAAITAPAEGQFAFTKDNNSLWYYDGAAWVASGATGDIEGVTAGVGISGGGTSGTVTVTNSMATAIDAKGDLVPGTGADTFSRLAVGANDTVLTADSSTATGLKWATPSSGGMTLLSTTTLSGASTTISSIDQSYINLYVLVTGVTGNTADSDVTIAPNNQAALCNYWIGRSNTTPTSSTNDKINLTNFAATTRTDANNVWAINFYNYTSTTRFKPFNVNGYFVNTIGSNVANIIAGAFRSNTALTSLVFEYNGNTFAGGTVLIYGVK